MKSILISLLISLFLLAGLGLVTLKVELVLMAVLLALLEITLSLDNAVVNVKTLMKMPAVWQKRFLYWGLPFAVFGMRLVFPVILVALTTPMSLTQVIQVAIDNPPLYAKALHEGMPLISGFGGGFLLMVFFNFVMEKWECSGKTGLILPLGVVLLIGAGLTMVFSSEHVSRLSFFESIGWGAGLNFIFQVLENASRIFKKSDKKQQAGFLARFFSRGFLGFLYLEVLDASFSFDGVLGAFAITQHIFVIMIGLGIGALFVRSFTLWMLQHKTLQKWKYLNDGAHYAVLFLAICILSENFYSIPEFVIAFVSVLIISVSIGLSRLNIR
jgi:hypothetical protein